MLKRSIRSLIAVAAVALGAGGVALVQAGTSSAASAGGAPSEAHSVDTTHQAIASRFIVSGIVQAKRATALRVFVQHGRVAGREVRRQALTVRISGMTVRTKVGTSVKRSATASRAASIAVGDVVRLDGSVHTVGGAPELDATNAIVAPLPSMALAGTVSTINGSTITLDTSNFAQVGVCSEESQLVTVDARQASVSLDGASASLSQVTTGATVVVTGERDEDAVVATSVFAFSSAPAVAVGTLASVTGNTLSLSSSCEDDESQSAPVQVDATAASIVLDGLSGSTLAQLVAGDRVLAVGSPGSAPLAATTVFAFSSSDDEQSSSGEDSDSQGSDQQATTGAQGDADSSEASQNGTVGDSDESSTSQTTSSDAGSGSVTGADSGTSASGD